MRESGFFDRDTRKDERSRPRLSIVAPLLLVGFAAGGTAWQLARGDRGTTEQPLEMSIRRAMEIRASGANSSVELSAHHQNIVRRVQAGIGELAEAARGSGPHAEWARRALAVIRESASDPTQ